jgi:2-methylisocitrate lyase-like PEP mutase family enzyme
LRKWFRNKNSYSGQIPASKIRLACCIYPIEFQPSYFDTSKEKDPTLKALNSRHQTFHNLHQSGCFIIPNPWDVGSARMMAAAGAKALATSSAAHAFTMGRPDLGGVSRDEALAHAEMMIAATDLPVAGDFENGFGDDPETVAETVRLAGKIGLSGCSIEDTMMVNGNPAYEFKLAVERIKAGSAAARALGRPFVFCARADGVMNGVYDLAEGIKRLQAFEIVGADLLYMPVVPSADALKQVVSSVSKPVNALAAGAVQKMTAAEIAATGARRISLGSMIARLTHRAIHDSVDEMLNQGTFTALNNAISGSKVDAMLKAGAAKN